MALSKLANGPAHLVGIIGGAVAGSEAAALCAEHGAIAIVLEQNVRPYGKIEDGLPRWHVKLRQKEYERIDTNLAADRVLFVPKTSVGRDVAFETLRDEFGLSALVLANGAWRDRPLPLEGIDRFVGRGLVYQNAFVHWFNHYPDPGYAGPSFDVPDGAIVVGGGLASIDVVKILNLELYTRALRARGIEADLVEMELRGIPETLALHGLEPDALGIRGCTLYYRRRKEDMPLASIESDDAAAIAKIQAARVKIMDRVARKYLVRFEPCAAPIAPIVEDDRLVGLRFRRTEVKDGRVRMIDGSDFDARAPLVISSIGSVPAPIPGVPIQGELYRFVDEATGALEGHEGVFGLGNVLTGRGNIKDSRENAMHVIEHVLESYLGLEESHEPDVPRRSISDITALLVRQKAEAIIKRALAEDPSPPEVVKRTLDWVKERWQSAGYDGDYRAWIAKHAPN